MIRRFAPAKVNLALHVTGRRDDGYHLLDSLVVFAGVGDTVTVAAAPELGLAVTGPRAAGVPGDARNLAWRAARALDPARGAAITLDKHLPHAGGIGGGSADAAAVLHALAALWQVPLPGPDAVLALGADVPVCLFGAPARMQGIGEVVEPVPALPAAWLVLANPGVEVPTGPVFAALATPANPGLPDPAWHDLPSLVGWLRATRNDLEAPARALVPEIDPVLAALAGQAGCVLARMSGSGGTCFGLFATEAGARAAATALARARPGWWIAPAAVRR